MYNTFCKNCNKEFVTKSKKKEFCHPKCWREKNKAYFVEWREKNKAYFVEWREKNKAYFVEYAKKNKSKQKKANKKYKEKNREIVLEKLKKGWKLKYSNKAKILRIHLSLIIATNFLKTVLDS